MQHKQTEFGVCPRLKGSKNTKKQREKSRNHANVIHAFFHSEIVFICVPILQKLIYLITYWKCTEFMFFTTLNYINYF
jgi:hypothetical protein